jgi:multidrug resistance protein
MRKQSALTLIFLTVFIDLLGFGILIPILPAFAKKVLLVDEAAIGIAIASYSFVQFLFNPIAGRLSDRFGRRPIIIISLLINASGYVVFAFTTSYFMLLVARIIAGIGGSTIGAAQAYIADVTTKENRAKGMGMIGAAFGLGFVFGPLIGGFLSTYGYMITGLAAAGFSLLAFLLTIFLLPESNIHKGQIHSGPYKLFDLKAIRGIFKQKQLAILIVLFFILTFSFANIYGTFALLGIDVYGFSDLQNGYMYGIVGLTSAVVQGGLIGVLTKLLGKSRIMIIGSFLITVTLALIPYAGSFLGLAIVVIFLAMGTGILNPTLISLISENTAENVQGITLGINQSFSAFARVLGPLWGGFAYEYFGYQYPFLTGAFFTLIIFLAIVFYLPRKIKV